MPTRCNDPHSGFRDILLTSGVDFLPQSRMPASVATSSRNPGRLQIGTGGRLHVGMHGCLRRYAQ